MTAAPATPPRRLLVIGWDAADWKIIHPLVDAGLMPTLASLIEQGCIANLATLRPCLSPMLWTSIATGKRADKHGVLGFLEPLPDASGVRLVGSTTRKTKAFWNITTQAGLKTHVIGWYASHPAEPINGVFVSDQFLDPAMDVSRPVPEGAIHPESLRDPLSQYRLKLAEIGAGDILPFIPQLSQIDLARDPRPAKLAAALAACASIHAVATDVLAKHPWDIAAVYYDALDRVGHEFMPYHPPRLPHIPEADFERYQHVIRGMYRFHDMMLETLLRLAGEETTIVLLSDHGFH
ncbi:MAG: alkaline phosphatase family protein, partial [Phycisphaerae bacterium]|nr:alkaline phosphatase family protein [Phycisphaerae bacterium]MDW8263173.1 alkaline phosphatase family protein [Phycisphaerales bacterium]